jgi:flagellar biosynthesis protein FlhG
LGDLLQPSVDQATGLRRLFEKKTTPLIAFASMRHGNAQPVGRLSNRVSDRVRLMMQFADDAVRSGLRVTMLDENPAPDGIAHAYGVESRKDMKHVLSGDFPLQDVMFTPSAGITVIPVPRVASMELNVADEASLAGNLMLLKSQSDYLMVDCVYRSQQVLSPIARRADQLLVTISPNADDLTQSYALIKRITLDNIAIAISVIVAHAADAAQAKATFEKLRNVALDHLGVTLHYQGAAMTPGVRRLSLLPPADHSSVHAAIKNGNPAFFDSMFSPLTIASSVV